MWGQFGWRRRKRRVARGEALGQTLSALGSVWGHTRAVAHVARYNDNRGDGRYSGAASTRRLLLWPTPLRPLVARATDPIWIEWIFIEQSLLWAALHCLLDNQATTHQSRERLTTGWRNA
jgi:hypothetical protein